ncbi:MAG: hypothetical protein EAZ27_13210 [Cytophagales bacterium]|nr:MAG: hypothetical protein EAZ27_13210 [Cytophagales bacterium]
MKNLILISTFLLFFGCSPKEIVLDYCTNRNSVDEFFDQSKYFSRNLDIPENSASFVKIKGIKKNGIPQILGDTSFVKYPNIIGTSVSTDSVLAYKNAIEINTDDILEYSLDAFLGNEIYNQKRLYVHLFFITNENQIINSSKINFSTSFGYNFNIKQIGSVFSRTNVSRNKTIRQFFYNDKIISMYVGFFIGSNNIEFITKEDIKSNFILLKLSSKKFENNQCIGEFGYNNLSMNY